MTLSFKHFHIRVFELNSPKILENHRSVRIPECKLYSSSGPSSGLREICQWLGAESISKVRSLISTPLRMVFRERCRTHVAIVIVIIAKRFETSTFKRTDRTAARYPKVRPEARTER